MANLRCNLLAALSSPSSLCRLAWIEAADEAVQAAKEKAENVHGRLDHSDNNGSPKTQIGQGVKQINEAKDKVKQVDDALQAVHTDLGNWKSAANSVLDSAVKKATEVHGKLDPENKADDHPIGHNIEKIHTSNEAIKKANEDLKSHVDSLNSWISTAEGIRQKAQKKAEEAYSKLNVHAELSRNVQKIVEANQNIKDVNTALGKVHGNLGAWKQEAGKVLEGAIAQATDVYDALEDKSKPESIGQNVKNIETAKGQIEQANKALATEVANLGNWNAAAKDVITKAEQKCEEILKKVDQKGKIYVQAQELQKKGTELLKAAKDAKQAVELNVTKALEAVVKMDGDLKRDLKDVKQKIKEGIQKVIKDLGVNELGNKVKIDLGTLKEKISDVTKDVDENTAKNSGLVSGQLKKLEEAKTQFNEKTTAIQQAERELENKFNDHIKTPLNSAVSEVDSAIGELGEKFTISGSKNPGTIHEILGHIHKEVAAIKGTPGTSWDNSGGSGLEGIKSKVKHYFEAFGGSDGSKFKNIVKGWIEKTILPHNGLVSDRINDKIVGGSTENINQKMAGEIKDNLGVEATEAGQTVEQAKSGGAEDIAKRIQAVKAGCEKFADTLDQKLKEPDSATSGIVSKVKGLLTYIKHDAKCICYCSHCRGTECKQNSVTAVILGSLSSVSRQVGNELNSVLLEPESGANIAGILDKITPIAAMLSTQLTQATERSGQSNNESPAQAVDSRLGEVRDFVNGKNGDNLNKIFKENVINTLTEKVRQLPGAVGAFDQEAQNQIKAAAKTAIERAAGQISDNGDPNTIELGKNGLMDTFEKAHKQIRENLKTKLDGQVDEHIGEDDGTGGVNIKATKQFDSYDTHVNQDSIKNVNPKKPESLKELKGHLPEKIKNISNDGLRSLTEVIGQPGGKAEITKDTFDKPFTQIKTQLEEIKKLVDGERSDSSFMEGDPNEGIKDFLRNLTSMLGNAFFVDGNKGLDEIKKAIEGLHKTPFTTHPKAIDTAVTAIKEELRKLRGKLKKDASGASDNDVINALSDLREKGLGGHWNGNGGDWKDTKGLTTIEIQLQHQNAILPEQTEIIGKAIKEIRGQLASIGYRLNDYGSYDDVVDQLQRLANYIGKGKSTNGYSLNLQAIHDEIAKLQSGDFTSNPQAIGEASEAIKDALKGQMSTLGSDVIKTLTNLMTKGMSEQASWKQDKNVNGFQKIQNDLNTQQSELSTQPTAIGSGVQKITSELDELRKQLQGEQGADPNERGVIKNMDFVIEKIGKDKNEGLEKIKKDIATLNKDTVPDINKFLGELCAKIASEAGSVDWKLGLFKENNIDKDLAKIKTQIDTLRIDDLQAAIAMCDKFLTNADYIKWEKVENIERFVDSEIEKAIAELTKQARRDYVESARDALKHFADKVAEELGEPPKEINRDLFVGYKGFMKQMEGERSENINRLRNVQSRMLRALSSAFQNFFAPLDEYLREEIERVKKQSDDEKNPSLPKSEEPYAAEWDAVHSDVNALLNYLCVTQGFDDRLRGLLHNLKDALTQLRPQGFQKPSTPTLDSVSRGLSAFDAEFGDAYISTYSGAECREADADKYAKVLLSFIPMTHEALSNLAEKCGTNWRSYKICKLTPDGRDNGLGNYLTKCGYTVSPTDGLQEGELQNHGDMNGEQIHALLNSPVEGVAIKMLVGGKPPENDINVIDIIGLLHNMLCRYLQVCHLKVHESPRYPCTVRDMLSWLSGLQYTPVADKLPDHCRALLNRKCDDNDAPNREDKVMVQCINGLPFTIAEACSYANSLLVTIQGHGRGFDLAAYPYSVDFANNTAQLYYPADPDELLEMMRRIICRLCSVLYFLYAQCCRATATTKGWRECHYGRQVPSSHWQCNTLDKQPDDATHNCPPTSPLQSFLTDSCPSLLPHKLSVVDNAIECADCPANLPGQQCLTPLGFWDLGLAASMRRTGKELAKSLGRLCSDADACLFQLCRTLRLLCPSAPQSLGDVFALFFQMLRVWDHESSRRAYSHHESYQTHLSDEAIDKLFPLWTQLHGSYQNSNLTNALNELAGHDHDNSGHNALSSLSAEPPCQSPSGCAPFLQPLALHANHTFPQKHAQLYVSWIVWLAWQLWELLESLLDALNNIDCTAHGCATCLCQPGNHGGEDACHCPSLVECGGPLPTLYRYGFTYRNAHALLAGSQKIRCSDLNDQLTKALHSDHFTQLFHQIDQLLYTIRAPFLFAIVALWLIATLYILGVLLYRMDVLRIRSHLLTTRASHQVDVKALLAGSRRMLSLYKDVDYFDDDFHS
ncbi:Extracellular matrix-binding ebh [Babesia ovata]|uniref:Extracellular matrix-binding ebh n=1 Tax=Babesia ovata TaxID=189622 RepID=A0A2H6KJ26_9APIC|nr:Extracellular matrix-binding ebh [Babesia ovata]GBE62995.1 Extracellular matrix-binding ebh [Babesia ovata]